MIKASAGGGGKACASPSTPRSRGGLCVGPLGGQVSFGDDRVFVEKFIETPATSRSRCWATSTTLSSTWASANAPPTPQPEGDRGGALALLDAKTRKAMGEQPSRSPRPWATTAPARWSSSHEPVERPPSRQRGAASAPPGTDVVLTPSMTKASTVRRRSMAASRVPQRHSLRSCGLCTGISAPRTRLCRCAPCRRAPALRAPGAGEAAIRAGSR